jgi:hypothetical protein
MQDYPLVPVKNLPMVVGKGERAEMRLYGEAEPEVLVDGHGYCRTTLEGLLEATEPHIYAYQVLATVVRGKSSIQHLWDHDDCKRALALLTASNDVLPDEAPPPEFSHAVWEDVRKWADRGVGTHCAVLELRSAVDWLLEHAKKNVDNG